MSARLRALLLSAHNDIDCAMNSLVWRDHQDTIEDLTNAQELLKCALDQLGDPDDPEELDFD